DDDLALGRGHLLVPVEGDHVDGLVVDDRLSVAVDDPPPQRGLVDDPHAVAGGGGGVVAVRGHLEEPQPREECAEEEHDDDTDDGESGPAALDHSYSALRPHEIERAGPHRGMRLPPDQRCSGTPWTSPGAAWVAHRAIGNTANSTTASYTLAMRMIRTLLSSSS